MKGRRLLILLYGASVFSSLLSSEVFINYNQLGFYCCVFLSFILMAWLVIRQKTFVLQPLHILFLVYIIFCALHLFLQGQSGLFWGGTNKMQILLLTLFHLFFLSAFLQENSSGRKQNIFWLFLCFLFAAVFQSIVSYLQLAGWMGNIHSSHPIGGTIGNPNVLATFLILPLVYVFNYLLWYWKDNRKISLGLLAACLFILPVVILCECRTAWIALIAGIIAGCMIRYHLFRYFRTLTGVAVFFVSIVLLSVGAVKLYRFKQASAEGRWYIWQLSAGMFLQKPLTGYGFDQFEKYYNLHQASYFEELYEEEKQYDHRLYAENAHNDWVEHLVETGFIGFAFFTGIFICAFWYYAKAPPGSRTPESRIACATFISWLTISLFNYNTTVHFNMLFLAFLLVTMIPQAKKTKHISAFAVWILIPLLLAGFVKTAQSCHAEIQLARLKTIKKPKNKELDAVYNHLPKTGLNLYSYAALYQKNGNKKRSKELLDEAQGISSHYDIYFSLAGYYSHVKQHRKAVDYYKTALNIYPMKIVPRIRLMRQYDRLGEIQKALEQARLVLDIQPVKLTPEVQQARAKAQEYIERMNSEN